MAQEIRVFRNYSLALRTEQNKTKQKNPCLARVAQPVRAQSWKPTGSRFDPQLGYIPWLFGPQLGHAQEATSWCFSPPDSSLSVPHTSSLSKSTEKMPSGKDKIKLNLN